MTDLDYYHSHKQLEVAFFNFYLKLTSHMLIIFAKIYWKYSRILDIIDHNFNSIGESAMMDRMWTSPKQMFCRSMKAKVVLTGKHHKILCTDS